MSDPIAPHSAPISAYMSVHQATNLAYVQFFGKIDNATSATFQSINANGFTVSYELPDGTSSQVYIHFKTPLTRREEIRHVLEEMAKEAETALGLPSSLDGPPPLAAIAKALYAQTTDIYTPPKPKVPLDTFYPVPVSSAIAIASFLGVFGLLGYTADHQLPGLLRPIRESILSQNTAKKIGKGLLYIHIAETVLAFVTCLRRKWYSPANIAKWTLSTFIFGIGSMRLLSQHAKDVRGV
ncbi:unnamed protein product [Cunninghamella echinulata]